MMAWTFLPISVPRALWSRNMSPVEMCGMASAAASSLACVPFPAPGGPSRMRITVFPSRSAGARGAGAGRDQALTGWPAPRRRPRMRGPRGPVKPS